MKKKLSNYWKLGVITLTVFTVLCAGCSGGSTKVSGKMFLALQSGQTIKPALVDIIFTPAEAPAEKKNKMVIVQTDENGQFTADLPRGKYKIFAVYQGTAGVASWDVDFVASESSQTVSLNNSNAKSMSTRD